MHLRPLRTLLYTQIRNNCTNKCSDKCVNDCDKIVQRLDNINTNLSHICALSIISTAFNFLGISIPLFFW